MTEFDQYIADTESRIARMMERPDIYYYEINEAQHDLKNAIECSGREA